MVVMFAFKSLGKQNEYKEEAVVILKYLVHAIITKINALTHNFISYANKLLYKRLQRFLNTIFTLTYK